VLATLDKELVHQHGGAVADEQIKRAGQQIAADYLCIAEVSSVRGGEYYLEIRMVNVETAERIAGATARSTLEDSREMVRAAQQLALELTGKMSEADALKLPDTIPHPQAPPPITAQSREAERRRAEEERRAEEDERRRRQMAAASQQHPTEMAKERTVRPKPESRVRYGGRAAAALLTGEQSNSSGGWLESKSSGAAFSLGLTMSVPLANAISLNPELGLDIKNMELSVLRQESGEPQWHRNDNVMEYALTLPILVRFDISRFYAEAGLRFDYPLNTDLGFAGCKRAQVDMGGVLGAGIALGAPYGTRYYLGYRIEANITDFDDKGYFRFYRQSLGLTLLF
jgi:hypothetical protein